MKRTWSVSAVVSGNQFVGTYEAKTGEEAIEMAGEDVSTSFCHQCGDKIEDAEVSVMTAESGEDVVTQREYDWEDAARAAGWTPPKKKRAKKEQSK